MARFTGSRSVPADVIERAQGSDPEAGKPAAIIEATRRAGIGRMRKPLDRR
ncbi:hypothetical protein [Streptosporangium sp. OZ121]|uniref:hypothetical protein n=1 Tax=Streptosporangium sp. OZ121 TaxID=3444183 RepID=UPI003F7ADAD1